MEEDIVNVDEIMRPATPHPLPPKESGPTSFLKGASELLRFLIIVGIIVVGIRVFIAQPFVVSGTSMIPAFQDANYLIVDEISYRFKEPERGDVVIFHPPVDEKSYYIKRIIGVPGDTVILENDTITIKNEANPEGFKLPEPYIVTNDTNESGTYYVTPGNYFVMGDNRPVSFDSRRWGLLPKQNIIGRALVRLFPITAIDILPGAVIYADQ